MHSVTRLVLLVFFEHVSAKGVTGKDSVPESTANSPSYLAERVGDGLVNDLLDGLFDRTFKTSRPRRLDETTMAKPKPAAQPVLLPAALPVRALPSADHRQQLHSYYQSTLPLKSYRPHFLLGPHQLVPHEGHEDLRHVVTPPEGHFSSLPLLRGIPESSIVQTPTAAGAVEPKVEPHRGAFTPDSVSPVSPVVANTLRERMGNLSPQHVTELSAVVNILLSFFKIGVGTAGGSAALVADGAHSFSDLISDAVCWASVQLGQRPADASHPQGYAIYEHIGSASIAAMLIATGVGMAVQSGAILLGTVGLTAAMPQAQAALSLTPLVVAAASVASKELLFHMTFASGQNYHSPSTIANAYHHRSDALSSLVAVVGIGGALMGCAWLDPLAATVVGLMVARMGLEVAQESISGLAEHMSSASKFVKFSPA